MDTTARLARAHDLRPLPAEAAEAARDKFVMRVRVEAAGLRVAAMRSSLT